VVLSLLVLGDGAVERAVLAEATVQGARVGAQHVDVTLDHVVRQPVQLRAEVDVLASLDELLVEVLEPVERDVP
jgi:hypothetical protein